MTDKDETKGPTGKHTIFGHLKTFGIAIIFGMIAYGGIRILHLITDYFGLSG